MIAWLGWRLDVWLTGAMAGLLALGVLTAVAGSDSGARQAILAAVALGAFLTMARLDYRQLCAPPLPGVGYVLALGALGAVLALGVTEFGSQRWLGIAGLTVQPSEFAKVALVAALAAFAASRPSSLRALLASMVLTALPFALVALQPDAGTALVLLAVWFGIVITWGAAWRSLAGVAVTTLAVAPVAFALAVPDYQRERIAIFVDPDRDPLGSGFTLGQVELALASGGITGRGLLPATESALAFVPARSSDFVFALIGEQAGLLGAAVVLALLATIAFRGLVAAARAPDGLGRVLAAGLTALIFTQAAIHIAVNVQLVPATGIPLPFVSQGGSSLLAMALAAGLIASVAAREQPSSREQWTAERWRR